MYTKKKVSLKNKVIEQKIIKKSTKKIKNNVINKKVKKKSQKVGGFFGFELGSMKKKIISHKKVTLKYIDDILPDYVGKIDELSKSINHKQQNMRVTYMAQSALLLKEITYFQNIRTILLNIIESNEGLKNTYYFKIKYEIDEINNFNTKEQINAYIKKEFTEAMKKFEHLETLTSTIDNMVLKLKEEINITNSQQITDKTILTKPELVSNINLNYYTLTKIIDLAHSKINEGRTYVTTYVTNHPTEDEDISIKNYNDLNEIIKKIYLEMDYNYSILETLYRKLVPLEKQQTQQESPVSPV